MNVSVEAAKRSTLDAYSFYQNASATLRHEIESHTISIRLKPGRYYYDTGEFCHQITLIGDGDMRIGLASSKGREIALYRVHPGDCCALNLLCALFKARFPACCYVDEPLRGVAVPTEVFQGWINQHSEIRSHVMEELASRLSEILRSMEGFAFRRLEERVASLLLVFYKLGEKPNRVIKVTHHQIALELGSVREVISRTLSDFENASVVMLGRGKINILDVTRLTDIAEGKLILGKNGS